MPNAAGCLGRRARLRVRFLQDYDTQNDAIEDHR